MKIVRERPCQRRHHRVEAPLFVEFQGIVHRATDWSLGGLRLDHFPGTLPEVDSEVSLTLSLPFQGFEVVYPVRARVVRIVAETTTFAVEFTELGERESNLMEHFIEQLIRGSMMPVEDTIQRIDIPVTPISTQPDINPSSAIPLRRWPVKTILMTSLYMLLGLFIISYVGLMIYSNYFRLEIETAVVTVPIETSVTHVDGMVLRVDAQENQIVSAGQPLIWIEDPRLERDITVVEAEVERRRADLEQARRRLVSARGQISEYKRIDENGIKELKFEIDSLTAQRDAAVAARNRIKKLLKQGYATRRQFDEVDSKYLQVDAELNQLRVQLRERVELAEISGVRFYNGDRFVADLEELQSRIEFAGEQYSVAQQKLINLSAHREKLVILAPFDGILRTILKQPGSAVVKGDGLAVFERNSESVINAYLNQEEVLQVGMGDEALVYLPAINRRIKATVVGVDRTSSFVDEQRSKYTWRGPEDRSALVTLALNPGEISATELTGGLPAVVIFERQYTSELIDGISGQVIDFVGEIRENTLREAVAEPDLMLAPAKPPVEP